jgi:SAM-dependent methyltransferase
MTTHDPRDLEWQRRYEQNDTPWDKGQPAPALIRYLQQNPMAGRILVPGCGRGHEARALAQQDNCSVVGLDLSPLAVADATRLATDAGMGGSVNFVVGDFFQQPAEMKESFDWLVEHTCFCAIEPSLRADYVRSAAAALRPGGKLFGIFYLTPDVESGPPFAVTRDELTRLFELYFNLQQEWVPGEAFAGRENRELVRILEKR